MVYKLYSVRDSKVSFAAPFIDVSDDSAKRGLCYAFSENPSLMTFSPSDFSLFRIGEFDNDTGSVLPCVPVFICSVSDFIKSSFEGGIENAE